MRTAVRVAEDSDVSTLAALRRAWMEENAGGPIDDPDFEAAFREWWKTEHDTRTFFLLEVDGLVHLRLAPSPRSVPFYARLGYLPGAVVELDPPT